MAVALRERSVQESVGPVTEVNVNIRNTIFGPGLWAVAAGASALSLGGGSGAVVLGAPVDLSFELQPDPGTDIASSCVTAKLVAGDNVVGDSKVRVVPLPEVRGRPSGVRVLASIALDEPVLTVTLSAGCVGRVTRTYTFLPDLPTSTPRYSSASPVDLSRLPSVSSGALVAGAAAVGAAGSSKPTVGNATTGAGATAKALDLKEASNSASRAPAAVKPPKNTAVRVPDTKSASTTRNGPTAAAPQAGRSRLVVEPLDTWLESPMALRTTPELLLAPSQDASPQRAQAAALWKSLNTQPEDLQKDGERLKTLEANAVAVRKQATKDQADVAQLREQLERVEQERFPAMVVYVLGALLLLALLGAAWIWMRLRSASQLAVRTWRDSVNIGSRDVVAAHEAAMGLAPHPSDDWVPPETLPTPEVHAADSRAMPIAADTRVPFVSTKPVASAPAPLSTAKPTVATRRASLHMVNPGELFDIQQQAEFFISVGEHQQAIDVLKKHIAEYRESSPLAYLELLRLYHTLSRADDFAQLRSQFMQFFNAQVPEFVGFHRTGRMLYHYTDALAEIEAQWTTPAVVALLEALLFRRTGTQAVEPFDLAAYDDLLLLLSIAQTTPASARGAPPPRQRTTPVAAPMVESRVDEAPSAVLPQADLPLDSLAASLEFDFELVPQRSGAEHVAPVAPVAAASQAYSGGGDSLGIPLDLDLSEPVHLTLSDLPAVPVTSPPTSGQPVGFGMDNDLMELRLELEQKKPDSK